MNYFMPKVHVKRFEPPKTGVLDGWINREFIVLFFSCCVFIDKRVDIACTD